MPLVTFADFVAEQAVGILIGAAAILAAPKAGPKLVEMGADLTARAKAKATIAQKGVRPVRCSYNFKLPSDPIAIIEMVRPMIEEAGGTVTGKNTDVTFSIPTVVGRFDGACRLVEPSVVNISVIDKPDIVSCKMIRDQLTVYITEAVKMYHQRRKAIPPTNGATAHG